MNKESALLIKKLKLGCTYRRLAEIYYPEDHDLHGMQFAGEELCEEAFKALYPDREMRDQVMGEDPPFDKDNKSTFGDFYWWE